MLPKHSSNYYSDLFYCYFICGLGSLVRIMRCWQTSVLSPLPYLCVAITERHVKTNVNIRQRAKHECYHMPWHRIALCIVFVLCFATCFNLGHFVAQHPCTKVLERWSDLVGGVFKICWGVFKTCSRSV